MKELFYCVWMMLILSGCEYAVHDNFIELEKPPEGVDMAVYLHVENDGETIPLWNETTTIRYDFTASNGKPAGCVFRMGDQTWSLTGASGSFTIDKRRFTQSKYTLECAMYANTGSGSIAEQVGMETYMGTLSWPVAVMQEDGSSQGVRSRIGSDGYLVIEWEKFPLNENLFNGYTISDYMGFTASVADINQLTYVCKSYVGQGAHVQVSAKMKNSEQAWKIGSVGLDRIDPALSFDYSRTDSIRIIWNNPYKSMIAIYDSRGNNLAKATASRTVGIPYAPFGGENENLYVTILAYEPSERGKWTGSDYSYNGWYGLGVSVAPDENWPRYGYNVVDNVLYVSSYGEVTSWQLPQLDRLGVYKADGVSNADMYSLSRSGNRMAVCYNSEIRLFTGKEMQQVKAISLERYGSVTGTPTVLDNGELAVVVNTVTGNKLAFYHATTGALIAETLLDIHLGREVNITTDGAYVVGSNYGDLVVLTLSGHRVTGTRKVPVRGAWWCISPLDPDQLYVSDGSVVRQYRLSDLSVANTWNMPDVKVGNIDPKTGNLLLHGNAKAYVMNPKTGKILYSSEARSSLGLWLYGNVLLSDRGYALNLEKELQK